MDIITIVKTNVTHGACPLEQIKHLLSPLVDILLDVLIATVVIVCLGLYALRSCTGAKLGQLWSDAVQLVHVLLLLSYSLLHELRVE